MQITEEIANEMSKKFLQINLGRGKDAQALMMQKAAENDIDILLISEPYGKQSTYVWYEDTSHRAAILIRNKRTNIMEVNESNLGFVYVTINSVRIYSCYFSPNINHEDFTREINNL